MDNLILQKHQLLSDPFTKDYCVDCTRPVDDKGQVQYEQYTVDLQDFYAHFDERSSPKQTVR
jgi:hypothetical protein